MCLQVSGPLGLQETGKEHLELVPKAVFLLLTPQLCAMITPGRQNTVPGHG